MDVDQARRLLAFLDWVVQKLDLKISLNDLLGMLWQLIKQGTLAVTNPFLFSVTSAILIYHAYLKSAIPANMTSRGVCLEGSWIGGVWAKGRR